MTNHDKQVTRKIVRDFLARGCTSCGNAALDIAAGLLGADDVASVAAAAKDGLTKRGVVVQGPGLQASA